MAQIINPSLVTSLNGAQLCGPMSALHEQINEELGLLHSLLSQLESTADPFLQPCSHGVAVDNSGQQPKAIEAPIVAKLTDQRDGIQRANARLRDIIGRIVN